MGRPFQYSLLRLCVAIAVAGVVSALWGMPEWERAGIAGILGTCLLMVWAIWLCLQRPPGDSR